MRVASKLLYVAGKASMPLGASFALFGKLGIAANQVTSESSTDARSSVAFVRPVGGFGIGYKLSGHVGAVLEYNYYGNNGKAFTQQKLELGLKYAF